MKQKLFLFIWVFLMGSIPAKSVASHPAKSYESHYDFLVNGICYNILSSNTVEVTYNFIYYPLYYNEELDYMEEHGIRDYCDSDDNYYVYNFNYGSSTSHIYGYSSSTIHIPASVTYNGTTYQVVSIGEHAFENCVNIKSIYIDIITPPTASSSSFWNLNNPKLYVPIGSNAAYQAASGWSNFSNIIPYYVPFTDSNVKALCVANWDTDGDGGLSTQEAAAVTDLGTVFTNKTNITSFNELSYFTGLTSIRSEAFCNCSGLTTIIIPNGVTSIGSSAFSGCSSLTSVTIPKSVTSIRMHAFSQCTALNRVNIKDLAAWCNISFENEFNDMFSPNPLSIAHHLYLNGVEIKDLVIPNNVTTIKGMAFNGCSGLTSVTIPNSVTSIEDYAFRECTGLVSVTIGDDVLSIGKGAFQMCSNLTSFALPNNVTSIGEYALFECTSLPSLTVPNSVTSIGRGAFCYCSALTSISVGSDNTVYDSRGNCNAIIETQSNTLIAGCKNTIIPFGVTSIGNDAFAGCTDLTSIEIPSSVTGLGESAFDSCSGLASVTIPNSVTRIGNYAFWNCSSLASVTVEWETPITINSGMFPNYQNIILYVPYGCRETYLEASIWKDFEEIVEMAPVSISITMATGSGSPRTMIGFSSANGLDFTNVSDVKAYIAVGFTASKDVLMARVNIVPPYTGVVLLTTEPGCTVEVPTTEENVYYANLLMPAVGSTLINPTETIDGVEYTNLLVGKLSGTETMGFVQFSTPNYYTNKSYLHIPSSVFNQSSSAPVFDGLGMVFEDAETTDIRQMMQPEQETDDFYDLQGRKVTPTRKGLYIKNGKKVVIK